MTYTITPMNRNDFNRARELLHQNRLAEMYDYLESFGHHYAILARGVVNENTFSGIMAVDYMNTTAADLGRVLTDTDMATLRQGFAAGYLNELEGQFNSLGSINRVSMVVVNYPNMAVEKYPV